MTKQTTIVVIGALRVKFAFPFHTRKMLFTTLNSKEKRESKGKAEKQTFSFFFMFFVFSGQPLQILIVQILEKVY